MSGQDVIHKDELLEHIRKGWDEFQAYINTLTEEQFTTPTDAAVWEDDIYALLEKQNRREAMGLDEETWTSTNFDRQNAVIQQQHKDKSLAEVQRTFREIHERLVAKVESLTDEQLQLPYRHYDPADTRDKPVTDYIRSDTYEHRTDLTAVEQSPSLACKRSTFVLEMVLHKAVVRFKGTKRLGADTVSRYACTKWDNSPAMSPVLE